MAKLSLGAGAAKKNLSMLDVWAIGFGCIVGWGAFVMPGTTFIPVAGPLGTVIALLLGAAVMVIIGMNFAYLMKKIPGSGGVHAYTREAFGKDHAFLCSWFLSLSYISIIFLNATALSVVTRTVFGEALRFGISYNIAGNTIYLNEVIISSLTLFFIGMLFVFGRPLMRFLQTGLAAVLLIGSVIITFFCLPNLRPEQFFAPADSGGSVINGIFTIVLLSPWAYVGFDVVCFETDYFRFSVKKSFRVILLAIICGAFVYTAMSVISVTAFPDSYASCQEYFGALDKLGGVEGVPTFFAAQSAMGEFGVVILGITACAAILTGIIAAYRSSTNIFTTMANDKILSKKFRSTSFCVVFMMVISISVSFMGRNALIWFVELTTLGAIVGFAYTSASAFVIAKRNKNKRNMTVGITGAVFTAVFAVVQLVPGLTSLDTIGPQSFFMLALWCLLGFAFYWRSMRQSSLSEYNGNFFASTALFAMLLYSALMWYLDKIFSVLGTVGEAEDIKLFTVVFFSVIAVGMGVMIYIQKLLRQRHSEIVREKIRAEENNKAKSRFLFNMSHDIRTPMNAIIGFTNLALKENNSPKLDNYLNKIKTSSRHLLELINDILEMSRIENGSAELNLRPEDICEIISQTYDLFTSQMQEKGIEFTIDISAVKHNYVMCDSKNLNRILMNIVGNAYKFTPENGKISVTASEMTTDDENLSIYQLKVSDTGIGMSPDFAKKIFNAFERERTSTVSGIQGTGLGMAITKSIVDLMEGTIEVITEKGKGTTFVIDIPLQITEAPEKPEEEETTGIAVDPSGIRMLLVEDNLINMEIASLILRENGFEFDTAENGKEAYEKVASSEPGYYSVVLMDIQMPVMDGYEAARNIRALKNKELASVPIIALTANAFKEDERAAGEAGMQGHIAKPIDVGEMMKTLSLVLKK